MLASLLLCFGWLCVLGWQVEESLVLRPGSPLSTHIEPFEVYEVLIPTQSLTPHLEYQIKVSSGGGASLMPRLKRKPAEKRELETYSKSDFAKRHKSAFAKGLRDVEASSIFKIDAEMHYVDDQNESKFEIIKS